MFCSLVFLVFIFVLLPFGRATEEFIAKTTSDGHCGTSGQRAERWRAGDFLLKSGSWRNQGTQGAPDAAMDQRTGGAARQVGSLTLKHLLFPPRFLWPLSLPT